MKKISFLTLALFTFLFSMAQKQAIGVGVKGGVNIADYSDNANSSDNRVGYHAGIFVHLPIANSLALQPEVIYSSQGSKLSDHTDKVNYINIPVLLQYQSRGGFRIETGPQLGILTTAKSKDVNGNETDVKDFFKSTDVDWAFGLGYITPVGLGIDARYNLGITKVFDFGTNEVKNRVWQFGVFYQFHH